MNPLVACLAFFTMTNLTVGGTGYEVTAQQDGKPVTYMVNFGGEFNFEQYTAYDPVSKKNSFICNGHEMPTFPNRSAKSGIMIRVKPSSSISFLTSSILCRLSHQWRP